MYFNIKLVMCNASTELWISIYLIQIFKHIMKGGMVNMGNLGFGIPPLNLPNIDVYHRTYNVSSISRPLSSCLRRQIYKGTFHTSTIIISFPDNDIWEEFEDIKVVIRIRSRTDNTMAKRKNDKWTKGQTTMYKTLHTKLKIE